MHLAFDYVAEHELEKSIQIEQQGYPADEAATLEAFKSIRLRQSQAGCLFLGAYVLSESFARQLIGYICSTQSTAQTLTHQSMAEHVPSSSSVCIHSVCVSSEYRRQGVALSLLREYITRLKNGPYERVLLIAHEELIPLYQKAGFELVGLSSVVHGSRPWYEMRILLDEAVPLDAFENGLLDVTDVTNQTNRLDLVCPRSGCKSIILKAGVAKLVQRTNIQIDFLPPQNLPTLSAGEYGPWWLITPSPMQFENIAFSKVVDSMPVRSSYNELGAKLKLLACAQCGIGPLGWTTEGGSEFWLVPSRVRCRGRH